MKVYGANGNGCLVLVVITTILVMTVGFFGKILFTTPLGIVLLIAFGVKYMLDQRKKSSINSSNSSNSSFTQGESHDEFSSESYTHDENTFDRSEYLDVEEVDDYKNIDN